MKKLILIIICIYTATLFSSCASGKNQFGCGYTIDEKVCKEEVVVKISKPHLKEIGCTNS